MAATVSGGGGGPSAPRPCVDNPASAYAGDCEYRRTWGLAAVNAAAAYERIAQRDGAGTAPGDGAGVAVIDDGIDDRTLGVRLKSHYEERRDRYRQGTRHGSVERHRCKARPDFPELYSRAPTCRELSDNWTSTASPGVSTVSKCWRFRWAAADPNQNYEGTVQWRSIDDAVDWLAAPVLRSDDIRPISSI